MSRPVPPRRHRPVRRTRAGPRTHPHTASPAGAVERRAAGHDEQVVDALVTFSRFAVPQIRRSSTSSTPWPATAGCNSSASGPRPPPGQPGPRRSPREVLRKKISLMLGARIDDDTVIVHPSRARPGQADVAQDRLAGRGSGRLRRRRGPPDQPGAGRLGSCATTSRWQPTLVLGGRLGCGGAAVRRRQDHRRAAAMARPAAPPR